MGSKRAMLGNGLGEALGRSLGEAKRVFDLFTGSAAVAWHISQRYEAKVLASDLQEYSRVLAAAVIERTEAVTDRAWIDRWIERASERLFDHAQWAEIDKLQQDLGKVEASEAASRARDQDLGDGFPLSKAYGGYYFSIWQAGWLDALRATLPTEPDLRNLALASLIQAASRCAASPGHTAQPFKPNDSAGKFLIEAWRRDVPSIVRNRIDDIALRHAMRKGEAHCMGAIELADRAMPGDLCFLDPPYSGVHYSRFYHVLEGVARGDVGEVSGSGRYPDRSERPVSDFSMTSTSKRAFDDLLAVLARRKVSVVITFPAGFASNGLSGEDIKAIAADHFRIAEEKVSSRFSTLGGDLKHRAARQDADELILTLSSNM
jgi:adenine-specific DNA methylase